MVILHDNEMAFSIYLSSVIQTQSIIFMCQVLMTYNYCSFPLPDKSFLSDIIVTELPSFPVALSLLEKDGSLLLTSSFLVADIVN